MDIWGKLTGKSTSDAANAAAADTYAKQQDAIKKLQRYGDQYAGDYKDLSTKFDPYAKAGTDSLGQLMSGLGLGSDPAAFTAAYRATPGYMAGMEASTDAVMRRSNALGGLGGNTVDAMTKVAADYEDQKSGDYLSRLMSMVGMGQQATGQQVATEGQGLQGQMDTRKAGFGGSMTAAGTVGQGMVAGAQAEQDAWSNLLKTGAYLGGAALSGGTSMLGGGGLGGAAGGGTVGGAMNPMSWNPTGQANPYMAGSGYKLPIAGVTF